MGEQRSSQNGNLGKPRLVYAGALAPEVTSVALGASYLAETRDERIDTVNQPAIMVFLKTLDPACA